MATCRQFVFDMRSKKNMDQGEQATTDAVGLQQGLNAAHKWEPKAFWKRLQHDPVVLLVCSKFLGQRSSEGFTPALCLYYLRSADLLETKSSPSLSLHHSLHLQSNALAAAQTYPAPAPNNASSSPNTTNISSILST